MTDTPLVIPEDLKELYRASTNYEFIGYSVTTSLIERIARLEQQNKTLRESLKKCERCLTELWPSEPAKAEHENEDYAVNSVLNSTRAALKATEE